MKTFLLFLILTTSCFFCSCEDAEQRRAEERKEFMAFLARFSTDSAFQVAHVQFPFRSKIYGFSEPVLFPSIPQERWQFINFQPRDSMVYYQEDSFAQEIRAVKDTVRVQHKGQNNGFFVEYCFVREKSAWVLVQRNDFSF